MARCLRVLTLTVGLMLAACGDGFVFISVNTGVIVGTPTCQGSGGQFQLQNQGGLVVLVVITSNTQILFAGSGTGSCSDLATNAHVQVSGHSSNDRIVASSVTVQ